MRNLSSLISGLARFLWNSPYLLLTLTMLAWASNWIAGRALHPYTTAVQLAFGRWLVALLILLPFTSKALWQQRHTVASNWGILLLLGGTGVALFNVLLYLSVSYTEAVNAVLVSSSQPIVIMVFSFLFFRERINLWQGAGIVLSLLGVLWLITRGEPGHLLNFRFNKGDLLALAAMPTWALYTVLLRFRPGQLSSLVFLTVLVLVGLSLLLPPFLWEWWRGDLNPLAWRSMAGIVYVAVVPSLTGLIFWNRAVLLLGPNRAGQTIHLVPLFTAAMAFLALGERLHAYHLLAALLIFSGITLSSRKRV